MIGPHDSVARVVETAESMDLSALITREYDGPSEARQIAQELAAMCRVLMFTGEYPYQLASPGWPTGSGTELICIRHTAADLYRTIARLLVKSPGYAVDCPVLVVDVIKERIILEVVDDIGLKAEVVMLPSWQDDGKPDLDDLVNRHKAAHQAGGPRLSLTCFGTVFESLRAQGISCARIEHTHSAITDALRQAQVIDVAIEARERQPAVIKAATSSNSPAERFLRAAFAAQAVSRDDEGRLTVHTMRLRAMATVAEHTAASSHGTDSIGIGIGASAHEAELQAALALAYGQTNRELATTFENGSPVESLEHRSQGATEVLANAASNVGLAPLALYRLLAAFRTLNPDRFTVQDLAHAYGSTTRTARRLITRLRDQGLAEQVGNSQPPGAGRPSPLYRINSTDLLN